MAATTFNLFLKEFKKSLLIVIGVLCVGMGIKGFLVSSHFIDGGVTGVCMLLANILDYPIPVMLVILNIPFIVLGYRKIGPRFAIKTTFGILVLFLALTFIPYPDVTPDKLLTALFGGIFIGTGIGIAIRGGAVLDGTEIVALVVSINSPVIRVSDAILMMNVVIFTVALFVLGVEPALYSIVTYFAASRMIEFVVSGLEEYTGVTIISGHNEEIKKMIIEKVGRGLTIYKGTVGYGKRGEKSIDNDIIFTVMTRLEVGKLQAEIDRIDPNAFIIYQSINDIKGGIVKRRPLH